MGASLGGSIRANGAPLPYYTYDKLGAIEVSANATSTVTVIGCLTRAPKATSRAFDPLPLLPLFVKVRQQSSRELRTDPLLLDIHRSGVARPYRPSRSGPPVSGQGNDR
jgi:hypothetical protein